eukprot:6212782-Pleurochrysis_carterae.AAC.2
MESFTASQYQRNASRGEDNWNCNDDANCYGGQAWAALATASKTEANLKAGCAGAAAVENKAAAVHRWDTVIRGSWDDACTSCV